MLCRVAKLGREFFSKHTASIQWSKGLAGHSQNTNQCFLLIKLFVLYPVFRVLQHVHSFLSVKILLKNKDMHIAQSMKATRSFERINYKAKIHQKCILCPSQLNCNGQRISMCAKCLIDLQLPVWRTKKKIILGEEGRNDKLHLKICNVSSQASSSPL